MEWENMREAHHFMRDDFEQDAVERAYRRGCEHGYRKAMEEIHGGYGERGHYGERDDYGERGRFMMRGTYGERQPEIYYSERDMYGERRGVRGTGPYGHR